MAMEPSFLVARNVKKKFATKRNSNKYEIVHNSLIFRLFCFSKCSKGSMQNKFSVKVGIWAQGGGGGSDPIPTFFQN